ncbi:hypothetical protein [Lentzea sp. NBRC 102530]|uniref:hypothetical protein n=1 Tax=Lentzea sp. NBRC 102530 TaxID=3032201 RepID=UPI0024A5B158|nr:hypothetical protein [Lentzea sp. NBRC 102530]GLY49575.1 hypothetical protein Lesp01_32310 [Lentzea sp. NBRC 102530]
MPAATLLSFTLVALLTVLTPGLDTVMVLRTALLSSNARPWAWSWASRWAACSGVWRAWPG